jgi:hypothetical protein
LEWQLLTDVPALLKARESTTKKTSTSEGQEEVKKPPGLERIMHGAKEESARRWRQDQEYDPNDLKAKLKMGQEVSQGKPAIEA